MAGGEPRRERRVRQDVLALRQRHAQRRREVRHPLLRSAVAPVHRRQVLVVDVDPVQPVRLHPLRHRVRRVHRVRAGGRGRVSRAERGGDDLDAGLVVLGLLRRLARGGERGVPARLVEGALECEERERDDVVALEWNALDRLGRGARACMTPTLS